MPDKVEIQMLILLAIFFVVMLVVAWLMSWWDKRPHNRVDPAKAAINRVKRASIVYGIAMFVLIWRVPTSFYWQVGPENISEYAKEMAFNLSRMREVIYLGFMMSGFWAFAVYNALKEITWKVIKEPEDSKGQKAA
jgi:hypothetical protein